MQDEINEKVVALSVKGAKLTAEMLQKAIKAMLAQAKKRQEKQPHGKQTLKQLAKQNAGLSNIEITEGNIKAFEQTAKKYGILPNTPAGKEKRCNPQRLQRFLKSIFSCAGRSHSPSFSTSVISFAVAATIRKPLSLMLSSRVSSCRRCVSFVSGFSKRNWSTDIS